MSKGIKIINVKMVFIIAAIILCGGSMLVSFIYDLFKYDPNKLKLKGEN